MSKLLTLTLLFTGWAFYEAATPRPDLVATAERPSPEVLPDAFALATAAEEGADPLLAILGAEEAARAAADPAVARGLPDPFPAPDPFPIAVTPMSEEAFAARTGLIAPAAAVPPALASALTEAAPAAGQRRTVSASRLNMRAGPGTGYGVIASWPRGTEVTLIETDGNWGRVSVDGTEGWMSTRLLSG